MKKISLLPQLLFAGISVLFLFSCKAKNKNDGKESISSINLKRGDLVLCGPADRQLGTVDFVTSCSPGTKKDFDIAIALLHSFEYDEAEKMFAKVIDAEPGCAMAYWGVAMSNYHQVWPSPPSREELEKGSKAISIAQSLAKEPGKEKDFIDAMAVFYTDWDKTTHRSRSLRFEKAMEKVYTDYAGDIEVAIFYALSLVGAADPADKTFSNQKKAGGILTALYPGAPYHPGIVHYIIHSYDSPELAILALPAARKYASIAPSSAHAQHMPSHIFTRLGLWDEAIHSNLLSTASAKCYAEGAGIKGHWDEELHGLDYLVYAYLQKGETDSARGQLEYLRNIQDVFPVNFKVAYAFSAIPARYYLENKMWKEAAGMELYPASLPWLKYPWQKAIFHFARLLGNVHTGAIEPAKRELEQLNIIYDTLSAQQELYKANQVLIQVRTGEAWILWKEGKIKDALQKMNSAAELEDKTEKSPVTPGEVLPAKELLADMLLQLDQPAQALIAYEEALKKHPNRFNGLYGAGLASEMSGNTQKAKDYYHQLVAVANTPTANRPELKNAKAFLSKKNDQHSFLNQSK
ncbi:MAG: tetratricopeptide repeat protein [Chitinophagaceae bacterium]